MGAAENAPPGAGNNKAGGSRGRLVAERLSRDHKPESAGELERIQAAGGVVFPLPTRRDVAAGGGNGVIESTFPPAAGRDFGVGVPRVWRAGGDGPGLAMSRSIGDKVTLVLRGAFDVTAGSGLLASSNLFGLFFVHCVCFNFHVHETPYLPCCSTLQ